MECRCVDAQEYPTNLTVIEGAGVIPQAEGCDLFVRQLMVPASRQFQSRAEWSGPGVVVPQTLDLLLPGEVSYIRQHRAILEAIWDAREDPEGGTVSSTAPLTMFHLRQQMEVRTRRRKGIIGGAVVGSIVAAAIGTSLSVETPTDCTRHPSKVTRKEDLGREPPREHPGPPRGRADGNYRL
jgi:hypothetical protein